MPDPHTTEASASSKKEKKNNLRVDQQTGRGEGYCSYTTREILSSTVLIYSLHFLDDQSLSCLAHRNRATPQPWLICSIHSALPQQPKLQDLPHTLMPMPSHQQLLILTQRPPSFVLHLVLLSIAYPRASLQKMTLADAGYATPQKLKTSHRHNHTR